MGTESEKVIQSRVNALRCAAAMPYDTLQRGWASPEKEKMREVYHLNTKKTAISKLRQLDACKDDEARRLLLGISE